MYSHNAYKNENNVIPILVCRYAAKPYKYTWIICGLILSHQLNDSNTVELISHWIFLQEAIRDKMVVFKRNMSKKLFPET